MGIHFRGTKVTTGNTRLDQTSLLPLPRRCFKVDAKQQQLSSAAIPEKHPIIIFHIPYSRVLLPRIQHHRPHTISILLFNLRRTVAHPYDASDTNNKRLLYRGAVKLLESISTELRLNKRAAIARTTSNCTRGHTLVRTPIARSNRKRLACMLLECRSAQRSAHTGTREGMVITARPLLE